MKTFKFSLVLRTRENTDVFITLDDNIYGIHSKRVNILYSRQCRMLPSKHTTSQQMRYNVAATSWRCWNVVTTFWRRCVFAGWEQFLSFQRGLLFRKDLTSGKQTGSQKMLSFVYKWRKNK